MNIIKKFKKSIRGRDTVIADLSASKRYFLMLFIMYCFVYMTKQCYTAALADIVAEGVLTKSQTGTISAVFYLVYGILQPVGGIMADRYDPEKLIVFSLVGSSIANLIIFLNQNYYVMLIVWGLNALVQFPLWPAIFKLIASHLAPAFRKKAVFWISLSSTTGLALSFLVAAVMPFWQLNFGFSAAALLALAVFMIFGCRRARPHEVDASTIQTTSEAPAPRKAKHLRMPTLKLFWIGSFFFIAGSAALRSTVENSAKSFAPTMLAESYSSIPPALGNILNILIIFAGFFGYLAFRKISHLKIFKNEFLTGIMLLGLSLPFALVMLLLGKLPAGLIVVTLCLISMALSPISLVTSYYGMHYAKYGRDGTAAGMINAAYSVALMLNNYLLLRVADRFGWSGVLILWIAFILAAAALLLIGLPKWTKFKNKHFD